MQKINTTAGFSLRADTGFSLPELMVVLVILGILAGLALPRLRVFIARSRQAEAKNLLAQIHTLQATHQNFKDKFASWGPGTNHADVIGLGGGADACAPAAATGGKCIGDNTKTDATACTGVGGRWVSKSGAKELGFKPQNCSQLRYGYWIERHIDTTTGKEHYMAFAYGPSDTDNRIFPTCDGKKTNRSVPLTHPVTTGGVSTAITETVPQGDLQALDEDKTWYHDDIIGYCE